MAITYENKRTSQIRSSPSMAISMAARRMRSSGEEVIDLSLGEPDFDTPSHIVEAAYAAMQSGETRYTGPAGTDALRAAVVGKFERDNGLGFTTEEIAVSGGAKQIIFNAFLATLEAGDEVIVPAPYWVSYTDIVALHGGVPKTVACGAENAFKLHPEALEAAITPRTRWLLLNSPSNPSGAVYSRSEFEALGDVLERHPRILVMSDEIYEHIVFGETSFTSFGSACPQLRDRTLLVNGVSKAYAMTGWRLGYGAGPKGLIAGINKIQSQSATCASTISQAAASAALNGSQDFVDHAAVEYGARRELVMAAFAEIPGIEILAPQGAFYAFPKCEDLLGRRCPNGDVIATDTDLARYLLEAGRVATVPGAAFGLEPYIRISFATSRPNIEKAAAMIGDAVARLDR